MSLPGEFVIDSPSKLKRKLEMVNPFFFSKELWYILSIFTNLDQGNFICFAEILFIEFCYL